MIHNNLLKALRELTDYFDKVEPQGWVTLAHWHVGTCQDPQTALSNLGVNPRRAHYILECETQELADKLKSRLIQKGAKEGHIGESLPDGSQPGVFVYAAFKVGVSMHLSAVSVSLEHREEGSHTRGHGRIEGEDRPPELT